MKTLVANFRLDPFLPLGDDLWVVNAQAFQCSSQNSKHWIGKYLARVLKHFGMAQHTYSCEDCKIFD